MLNRGGGSFPSSWEQGAILSLHLIMCRSITYKIQHEKIENMERYCYNK